MANPPDKQTRIFLWSWPRSISTCLEKCLSFVDGIQPWHEPYTMAYMALLAKKAPTQQDDAIAAMTKQFIDSMNSIEEQPTDFSGGSLMPVENFTYPWIKSQLEREEPGKKYILIKDMAMSIYDHLEALPDVPTRHTFIIRHPYRFLTSQRKQFIRQANIQDDPADFDMFKASPVMSEEMFTRDYMHLLWKHVKESGKESDPIIIDAEDLMNHPDKILSGYLKALGIPYHERYVTWDESEGSIKSWKGALGQIVFGRRAGFFDKAFKSSRFLPNTHVMPKREELTKDILRMVDHVLPGYEEMFEQRIKPE